MLFCGVICEFDPFHNGHAYLLRLLRQKTGCDGILCVMSGSFTQRGEAAVVSKWARTEMALACGADFVFELPALFAVRDAAHFAQGGVGLLDALGADWLGFGSETGELAPLWTAARTEPDAAKLREGLKRGESFARARGTPLAPNDTLAVEYLRAVDTTGSRMQPVTVRREGSGYHDGRMGPLASATAVREALWRGESVQAAMPEAAYAVLAREIEEGAFQCCDGLDEALLALLRLAEPGRLCRAPEMSEGLENRLLHAAQACGTRRDAIAAVKCKRYTWARISRALTQAALGMEKQLCRRVQSPPYARLLGFRAASAPMLGEIKKRARVPIEARGARLRERYEDVFRLEMRASDLWALGCLRRREACRDLTEKIIILE